MQITNQWAENAKEVGKELGIQLGEVAILLRQLTRKLGPITPALHDQIANLPKEKLEQLADAVFDFAAIDQLQEWIAALGRRGRKGRGEKHEVLSRI